MPPRTGKTYLERFHERYVINSETGCWNWTHLKCRGRGYMTVNQRGVPAYRWYYEYLKGPVEEGLELDHLCRNPSCVNPAHLEPVTGRENRRRQHLIPGHNAIKTHCPKGHPYSKENTYIQPKGGRVCKICQKEAASRYYRRRKENALRLNVQSEN